MSKMNELYAKVSESSTLQAKFAEIMKDSEKNGEKETKEKLISFAKDAGFDVSFDEVQDYLKEISEKKNGALSEAELDMVAGGKSIGGILSVVESVVTFGVKCAIDSVTQTYNSGHAACDALYK